MPCAVWFSAETQPRGLGAAAHAVRLVLPDEPAAERLAEVLRGPRLSRRVQTPTSSPTTWHKLLINAVAGLMVLTGRKSGMFRRDDLAALGRATSPNASPWHGRRAPTSTTSVVDETIGMFTDVPEDLTTSILTDREHGRPLEWDIRNGVIVAQGRRARARHPDQRRRWCRCSPRRATDRADASE